jgi:hypothetical protein
MYTERERNFAYTHSLSHTHTQEFCVAMCVVSVYCNKPFSCWDKRAVPDSLNTYTNLPASYKLPVHKHTHTYTHTHIPGSRRGTLTPTLSFSLSRMDVYYACVYRWGRPTWQPRRPQAPRPMTPPCSNTLRYTQTHTQLTRRRHTPLISGIYMCVREYVCACICLYSYASICGCRRSCGQTAGRQLDRLEPA